MLETIATKKAEKVVMKTSSCLPESSSLELMRLQLSTTCSGCQFLVGDINVHSYNLAGCIKQPCSHPNVQLATNIAWLLSRGASNSVYKPYLFSYIGLKFGVGVSIAIKFSNLYFVNFFVVKCP